MRKPIAILVGAGVALALMAPTGGLPSRPTFQQVTVNGPLSAGAATFTNATVTGTLTSNTVLNATTINATNVFGTNVTASNFSDGGTLSAGASTLASLGVTGASTLASLGVTGASTLASLGVTGASTLASLSANSLSVSGNSTLNTLTANTISTPSLTTTGYTVLGGTGGGVVVGAVGTTNEGPGTLNAQYGLYDGGSRVVSGGVVGSPIGGNKGAGTLNAQYGLYVAGQAVVSGSTGITTLRSGAVTLSNGTTAVNFAPAFPTSCTAVTLTPAGGISGSAASAVCTASGFTANAGFTQLYYYIATGT